VTSLDSDIGRVTSSGVSMRGYQCFTFTRPPVVILFRVHTLVSSSCGIISRIPRGWGHAEGTGEGVADALKMRSDYVPILLFSGTQFEPPGCKFSFSVFVLL